MTTDIHKYSLASHRDAEAVGDFRLRRIRPWRKTATSCRIGKRHKWSLARGGRQDRLLVPEISRTVTKNKKMIHHGGR